MAQNNTTHSGDLKFSTTTDVRFQPNNICYAVQQKDWEYLKSLIFKCDIPFNWIEILASSFLSIGISFITTLYTVENPKNWFGYIGFTCTGVGILAIIICITLRKNHKKSVEQIQDYFNHIENNLLNSPNKS